MSGQLDIFDHDPARLVQAYRHAAQTALAMGDMGYFTARERADHHTKEAERLERLAAQRSKS